MARREDVDTAIWEDEDFDALSDDAALLYLWSFTNYRCGMAGIYQVKPRSVCEGRMTPARREAALAELAKKRFVFYIDGWMWVRTRVKHLRTRGEKIATAIVRDVERIPPAHPLRRAFLTEYVENGWVSKWLKQANLEDLSIPHRQPIDGLQGSGSGKGKGSKGVRGSGGKGKPTDPSVLPDDTDSRLADAARRCLPILDRAATARGANPVTLLAVYRAVESFPAKSHLQVAGAVEHWTVHGNGRNKSAKDIVARFRNFLEDSPDQAVRKPRPAYVDA